jgi:hypothetical protein
MFWTFGAGAFAARLAARIRHAGYDSGEFAGSPGLWLMTLIPPPGVPVAEAERFGAAVLRECRPARGG